MRHLSKKIRQTTRAPQKHALEPDPGVDTGFANGICRKLNLVRFSTNSRQTAGTLAAAIMSSANTPFI
jgi:hypothetical protein